MWLFWIPDTLTSFHTFLQTCVDPQGITQQENKQGKGLFASRVPGKVDCSYRFSSFYLANLGCVQWVKALHTGKGGGHTKDNSTASHDLKEAPQLNIYMHIINKPHDQDVRMTDEESLGLWNLGSSCLWSGHFVRVSEVQVEKWQYIHLMALAPDRLPLCHEGRTEVKVRVKGQDTGPPLFYMLSV